MVGDFQSALLTDILDTVHQLTGHTLGTQFIGQSDIEGYGQIAFVTYQPSWNVLADDFNVLSQNLLAIQLQLSIGLQFGNLLL